MKEVGLFFSEGGGLCTTHSSDDLVPEYHITILKALMLVAVVIYRETS